MDTGSKDDRRDAALGEPEWIREPGSGGISVLVQNGHVLTSAPFGFLFHEMFVHSAVYCHPDPHTALLFGGAEGSSAKELLRHRSIEQIDVCVPDDTATDWSIANLPGVADLFRNHKLETHFEPASDYLTDCGRTYDLIFVEFPDFRFRTGSFLRTLLPCLAHGGILAIRAPDYLYELKKTTTFCGTLHSLFPYWGYAALTVPGFPNNHASFCLASMDAAVPNPCRKPLRGPARNFKSYTKQYHKAIFTQAAFLEKEFIRTGCLEDGNEERSV